MRIGLRVSKAVILIVLMSVYAASDTAFRLSLLGVLSEPSDTQDASLTTFSTGKLVRLGMFVSVMSPSSESDSRSCPMIISIVCVGIAAPADVDADVIARFSRSSNGLRCSRLKNALRYSAVAGTSARSMPSLKCKRLSFIISLPSP